MIKFSAPKGIIVYGPGKVTAGVTVEVTVEVTDKEQNVLSLLYEDPSYTYDELAEKLSLSRKTVSGRIKKMKEKGLIQRIGSDKDGHWEILV